MNEDKLKKLEALLAMMDESLTKQDFVDSFEKVIDFVKKAKAESEVEVKAIRTVLTTLGEKIKANAESSVQSLENDVYFKLESELSVMQKTCDDKLAEIDEKIKNVKNGTDGKDGKDADEEKIYNNLAKKIPKPQTAEEVRDQLESLVGDERLDKSAIRGLEEMVAEATKNGQHVEVKGSSRGLFLSIDGVEKGILQNINLKAGTNMAIAYSQVNGQDTITFNASGGGAGGITVETPPETPDAIITVFTVTAEPQWVVADGTTYFDGDGYTYGALTVTMDVPPSATIRIII